MERYPVPFVDLPFERWKSGSNIDLEGLVDVHMRASKRSWTKRNVILHSLEPHTVKPRAESLGTGDRVLPVLRWTRISLLTLLCGLPVANLHAQSLSNTNSSDQLSNCIESPQNPCSNGNSQIQTSFGNQDQYNNPGSQTRQQSPDTTQLYVDSAGNNTTGNNTDSRNNSSRQQMFPPDPVTDLQRLARSSTGEPITIFGRDLFQAAPSTFAPGDQIAVTPDYVVGFGDEILLRMWGPETFNSQLSVDRSGSIYIPKVGAIHVAGLRFDELQKQITTEMGRTYRNFNLSVNLGRLRSIQVYVVGEARRPGAYTISSLSTVLNALFASGGPNVQGSQRHIQIRRAGQTLPDFDLYDLVLRGDKSKDIRLETGDTIFIPPVGPQVALAGSVRHPAIYELAGSNTLDDILTLAGGFSATAAPTDIRLERIESGVDRRVMTVALNAEGRHMLLRDGDVLYANHITNGYQQSVTIRGNLANPGRFPWHEGMRLTDIIPDRMSLLTNDYWRERNRLGVPVPLFEPLDLNSILYQRNLQNNGLRNSTNGNFRDQQSSDQYGSSNSYSNQTQNGSSTGQQDVSNQIAQAGALGATQRGSFLRDAATSGMVAAAASNNADSTQTNNTDPSSFGSNTNATAPGTIPPINPNGELANRPQNRIKIAAPEIDWTYAAIERLDPNTLKSSIVPFNLGRLVQDHDATQNLELRPGDVVTILSQNDVLVPIDLQTKFVHLEGEFASSGVYSVGPNETLDELVQRAGGLSSKAYLYGSNFSRESARVLQQQRFDEYIAQLSTDMSRAAAVRTASSSTGVADPTALAQQRSIIAQLRTLRATGRVVLEFAPASAGVGSIPKVPLENGDTFRVPSRPNTVSVVGAVYGQNVFLFNEKRRLEDYVSLAGKPNRIADRKHAFIIRADGSVFSRERAQGFISNNFDSARINPGDSIVIPEKMIKPSALRNLIDFSQILTSFGLAAAAINVIR
jgi:polysaccharide export outer membrane protein